MMGHICFLKQGGSDELCERENVEFFGDNVRILRTIFNIKHQGMTDSQITVRENI